MEYEIKCQCGEPMRVQEGAAGATFRCSCGRNVLVPSLDKLRQLAGLLPLMPTPELTIETLLASGRLPGTKSCASCGTTTERVAHVVAECERSWTKSQTQSGWSIWWLLAIFITPWVLLARQPAREETYGRDKVYTLPLPLCDSCEATAFTPTQLTTLLCAIDDYARLLAKFPDARLWLLGKPHEGFA